MGLRSSLGRFVRHNRWAWRYGLNLSSVLAYHRVRTEPDAESQRLAIDLRRNGIAISSVNRFPGLMPLFEELVAAVRKDELRQRSKIDESRARAVDQTTIGEKTFLYKLLGDQPTLNLSSIYARVALHKALLQTANRYFGMLTRLRYYNVWRTFSGNGIARESQLWHRDRDDLQIVKVFLYLSDVNDGAGPFTYAPRTHICGSRSVEPAGFYEGHVRRSTDDQMDAVVPRNDWVVASGTPGTIVFADTSGLHKGGLALMSDRLMFTCMYVSKASQVREFFGSFERGLLPNLSPAQACAVDMVNRRGQD